ncbi:group II intron reverse transcriptase/maturase [Cetobacterium sp.]|uniref:group II intron reverse transcriptase/maturase n=1 Tax=Cetobacterium sp. TaxID=2071632 RepID=UPI003EE59349
MKNSKKLQGKQITQKRGRFAEVEMEVRDMQKMQSNLMAYSNRESVNDDKHLKTNINLMDKVLERSNMLLALKRVMKNKGSHGVDNMKIDELREHVIKHWDTIKSKILEGRYNPSPVRRVEIPKPDGGMRLLGIPTVQDRMIQQAIAQILNKVYDPIFSENSYGFRPNKSAKLAIIKAKENINNGNKWVVDMDLEKFFDTVNHDILMRKLAKRIKDKMLLRLIRKYLKSGILINGIKFNNEDGTPQGGPLSPLLANIMLDELDKELEKRGHKFCRYADDCNIYVKSRKAGERLMISLKRLIEGKLKLKINSNKSAVDLVSRRKFLGFSFYFAKQGAEIRIHEKSFNRLKEKVKFYTNRNYGVSMEYRLKKLKETIVGWINYFGIAKALGKLRIIDAWIRRRLRACLWKQWKKIKTKRDNLVKLGVLNGKAWEYANTRKGYWRISKSPILSTILTNKYLENLGFVSLVKTYQMIS